MIAAAARASKAAGSKLAGVGRNRIRAPANARAAADQRMRPTFSPSKGIARIIANTGLRKVIAVASASGI